MTRASWAILLLTIQAMAPPSNDWPRLSNPDVFADIAYPIEALAVGQTGVVVVHVTTDDLGRVQSAETLTGPDLLGRAALENVKSWKLSPAVRNAAIVYRFDIEPGQCQDDRRSLSRLVHPNLVVISGCRAPGKPFRPPPRSVLAFNSRGPRPHYPAIAQSARIRGVVVLELRVNGKGGIEPRALTDIPFLSEAAVAHARQWTVDPTRAKTAIEVYEFSLDNEACESEVNTTFSVVIPGYVRLRGCPPLVNPSGPK